MGRSSQKRSPISAYNCIVAIDKPRGMTSHDVVNRVRSVFGERRVGHSGTLDPQATGVLVVEVGSATRLSSYISSQDKRYLARIVLGAATDTDDGAGTVIREGVITDSMIDPAFAAQCVAALQGRQGQIPPLYSAIKHQGKKAYEQARAGKIVELDVREVEIYSSALLAIGNMEGVLWSADRAESLALGGWNAQLLPEVLASRDDLVYWDVDLAVSKGTYIRSIARDLGQRLGCFGFIADLRRTQSGSVSLRDCVSLEALGSLKEKAALDPVALMGMRVCFLDEPMARAVGFGQSLDQASVQLYEGAEGIADSFDRCTSALRLSRRPPREGELCIALSDNCISALIRFESKRQVFAPQCVLKQGVSRGSCI